MNDSPLVSAPPNQRLSLFHVLGIALDETVKVE